MKTLFGYSLKKIERIFYFPGEDTQLIAQFEKEEKDGAIEHREYDIGVILNIFFAFVLSAPPIAILILQLTCAIEKDTAKLLAGVLLILILLVIPVFYLIETRIIDYLTSKGKYFVIDERQPGQFETRI